MPDLPALLVHLGSLFGGIAWTPESVAFHLGPIPVYFYGLAYAAGLFFSYLVITREARRRGLDARLVDNGIIIVAIAALIGGRLYHVIDQWQLYKDDWSKIILPPYTGLGVYGGILTGTIAAVVITRLWKQSFWKWADVIAPGLFVMQAVGRWGNFFNQELYGPPTDLPWGIAIDCAHRVVPYGCDAYPQATTFFHPLFLYESVSGILGAITLLFIARRWGARMRPGDLFLLFLIWYAVVRFLLETLRTGNWTLLGIPTAMIVSTLVVVGALLALAWRHRPGAAHGDRWGEPPARDEETYEVDDEDGETVEVDDEPDEAGDHEPVEPAATEPPAADASDDADEDDIEIVDDTGERDGGGDAARSGPGA